MTKTTKAVKQEFRLDYPSVAAAQTRIDQLSRGLDALRSASAEFARLKDAFDRLPAIEEEMSAIHAAMPEIERKDFEQQVGEYEITGVTLIDEGRFANSLRKYNVHGSYRDAPFTQALANQSQVLLAAVARRPELIPSDVLARAADPFAALLRHVRDVHRGYRD